MTTIRLMVLVGLWSLFAAAAAQGQNTTPPSVAITSPTSTYNATVGSTVNLVATAVTFNFNGSIVSVQFYDGPTPLGNGVRASGTTASGTWTYAWNTTGATMGLHSIEAVATDDLGVSGLSSPATIVNVVAPPSVAITSPTSTHTVGLGSTVTLTATASTANAGDSLTSVQFYDGATLLGSGTRAGGSTTGVTWTYAWATTGASVGLHGLTARATDNLGLTATSSPATVVNVATPPSVAITSPTSPYTAYMGSTVALVATASTTISGDSLASVQFSSGTTLLGSGTPASGTPASGTWTYAWNTTGATGGNHNLTANATDNLGLTATSSPATVVDIVIVYPTVAITSPTSTYTASKGNTVTLVATASTTNPGGTLASVKFYNGATLIGSGTQTSGTAASGTWTYAWATTGAAVGLHNITAKATDNLGTQAASSPATVVNVITVPTVAITSPTNSYGATLGSPVTLTATAATADTGGSLTSVQFFDGTTLLGNGTRASGTAANGTWTYGWATTGATVGLHNITAVATDTFSLTATSSPARVVNVITPPTVAITSPTSTLNAGRGNTVALTATASTADTGGSLASIQFYDGATLLGSGTRASGTTARGTWTYGWATASTTVGLHNVRAKATDNFGLTATSAPATVVNVVTPPSVAITSPTSTYKVLLGNTVALTATASTASAGGSIAGVQFYDGSTLIHSGTQASGTTTSGTWTYAWSTASATIGLHKVTAKVTDNLGLTATSAPATVVSVITVPSIAITSPTSTYAALLGTKVTLTATAFTGNAGGSLTAIQFYDGPTLLGSAIRAGGTTVSGTWTYGWVTTGATTGLHNLTAKAADNFALTATSAPATVVNVVTPPSVAILSPTSTYTTNQGSLVTLTATASTSNTGGSLASVRFYDGSVLLGSGAPASGTTTNGTWTYAWNTSVATGGNHNLTARATDVFSLTATSSPATVVNIVAPPFVAIASPTSPSNITLGSKVKLVATASTANSGGSIADVQFFDGATFLGSATRTGGTAVSGTWTFAWNTTGATVGLHTITAVATDTKGLTAISPEAAVVNVTVPPSVAITTPTSTYPAPLGSKVTLTVTASTPNTRGSLTSIQFYAGATLIGSGTLAGGTTASGTWTYAWSTTGVTIGLHSLTAKATDNLGLTATSSPATVVDVIAPPTVAILSPTSTHAATLGSVVNLVATASTPNAGGSIAGVQFFDGATFLGSGTRTSGTAANGTWTYAWNTTGATVGLHNLTAMAIDTFGLTTPSSPAKIVNVITPPAVAITSPTSTHNIALGSPVALTATASTANTGGSLASVQFYAGATLLGSGVRSGGTPASGTWTFATAAVGVRAGLYNITAKATDNFGLTATSAPPTVVNVTTAPSVAMMSPAGTVAVLGSTVTLTATASTPNAGDSIAGVRFYDGAALLGGGTLASGTTASGTWTYAWITTGATVGLHNLTARATDALGLTATSSPARVVKVVTPPSVAVTSPTSTVTAFLGSRVSLTATASTANSGDTITSVQFYDGSTLLGSSTRTGGTATSGTWTYAWATTGATVGLHNLTAKATDALSLTATSSPATVVNVVTTPSVAITSPTSTYTAGIGSTVNLTATASTPNTGDSIAWVEFFAGQTFIGEGEASGEGVYTLAWDMAGATAGVYKVTAIAVDALGFADESWPPTVIDLAAGAGAAAPKAALAGVPGDGNGDGIVDGVDYGIWQNGYLRSGASALAGDYNGDGVVDGTDYGVWQNAYNASAAASDAVAATDQNDVASTPMAAAPPVSTGIAPRLIAVTPASGAVVSNVTTVTLVFDSDVLVGANAVEVSGLATGSHADFTQVYDAASRTLALTWATPLPADVYTVRVIGSFVVGTQGGEALDGATGNPAAATLPSGNGTPGSDARVQFTAE